MANWRYYSNVSIPDTLAVSGGGNLSTGATSIYAGSGAPVGYPTSFPWILQLEPNTANFELVLVTAGAGTAASPWIITRAPVTTADGGVARTHTAGTPIQHTLSAGDLTAAAAHEAAGAAQLPHGLPAGAWLPSSFVTLAETITTSGQTAITGTAGTTTGSWSSIPGTYKNLLIVAQGRLVETPFYSDEVQLTFNGDAGAHYGYATIFASNPGGSFNNVGTPGSGSALPAIPLFRLLASGYGSGANAGGGFAFIPNYSGSTWNKNVYSISGGGDATTSFMDHRIRSCAWNPVTQAAITAISITAPTGGYMAGCFFGLYAFG